MHTGSGLASSHVASQPFASRMSRPSFHVGGTVYLYNMTCDLAYPQVHVLMPSFVAVQIRAAASPGLSQLCPFRALWVLAARTCLIISSFAKATQANSIFCQKCRLVIACGARTKNLRCINPLPSVSCLRRFLWGPLTAAERDSGNRTLRSSHHLTLRFFRLSPEGMHLSGNSCAGLQSNCMCRIALMMMLLAEGVCSNMAPDQLMSQSSFDLDLQRPVAEC